MVARVAVQAVDELVVFDQAVLIEATHLEHRVAAETGKGARDQQQAVEPCPRIPRQEIADVLVGLEPLEDAAAPVLPTHGRDHAGGRHEVAVLHEGAAHGLDGATFQQGVAVDREHDVSADGAKRLVEGSGLAALRQSQPSQAGHARARGAQPAQRGCPQAPEFRQEGLGVIAGAIVGNDDLIRAVGLIQKGLDGHRQHGRFIVRGHDHGQRRARATCRGCARRLIGLGLAQEAPGLRGHKEQQQAVVAHIGDAQ